MEIKPDEIATILRQRIQGLDAESADLAEVGTVLSVADGIARVHGLDNCMSLEMLELPNDVIGLALNLESDNVGAVLFGDWDKIEEGDTVKRTGKLLEIPVGRELLGTELYVSEMHRIAEAAAALHSDRDTLRYQNWARHLDESARVLLIHRHGSRAQWELPGGKVEEGESSECAARRELCEELGIWVRSCRELGDTSFREHTDAWRYTWYLAEETSGRPELREPERFDDLRHLNRAGADGWQAYDRHPRMIGQPVRLHDVTYSMRRQVDG